MPECHTRHDGRYDVALRVASGEPQESDCRLRRRITSDGGVVLLAEAERRLGLADKLAAEIANGRDQGRVVHRLADILRARILAIGCGWEDADNGQRWCELSGRELATAPIA